MKTISPHALARSIAESLATEYPDKTLRSQYAWWCIETILETSQAHLMRQPLINLTQAQELLIASWIDQMTHHHKPIQYLIGSVPFGDLDILVEPPTLIPRPETEEWCLQLIEQLKKIGAEDLNMLDLCTGSGCIALAIAHAFTRSNITATDISHRALLLTEKNAVHNHIENVSYVQSDLYEQLKQHHQFDIIISNPPYIAPQEWDDLDPSVRQWEDKQALIAQDDGYAIIKKIISGAKTFIRPNKLLEKNHIPQLLIEIGYAQAERVVSLMRDAGFYDIRVMKDLEEKDRVVTARVYNEANADV